MNNFNAELWKKNGPERIREGLLAKFKTHPNMKTFLKDTGKTQLVECSSRDKYFGIGLPLHGKDKFNRDKWQGENVMGQLLMEVCDLV